MGGVRQDGWTGHQGPDEGECGVPTTQRTRDPGRRDRILLAATGLAADRGFATISLTEIGTEAGIRGTGIYRYFASKSDLLVALIDRVVDQLVADAGAITTETDDPEEALDALILDHIDAELTDREVFRVYLRDAETLPAKDLARIKSKMRRYVDEWVGVLDRLHPGIPDAEMRTVVQAAVGAMQSALYFDARLPVQRLTELLAASARGVIQAATAAALARQHQVSGG
jgi:AcrR family transcriptional regulator